MHLTQALHTHTLKVFWYLQPSFPRKHPPGWFIGMTTKSMWRGTHMCSHFSLYLLPQHVPMSYHVQFWWAPAKWRLIIVFLLVASWHWIYTLLSTHTVFSISRKNTIIMTSISIIKNHWLWRTNEQTWLEDLLYNEFSDKPWSLFTVAWLL